MVLKIKEEDRGVYVYEARKAYRKCRNKKAKKDFLDRFVEESGYNRKQAIRLLQIRQKKKETLRRGAPSGLVYTNTEFAASILVGLVSRLESPIQCTQRMSVYITKDKQDAYCKELTQWETRVLLSLGRLCFSNVIMVQRIFRTTALRVSTACEPLCQTIRILETEIITLIKVKF